MVLVEPVRSDVCRQDPEVTCQEPFIHDLVLAPRRGLRED